MADVLNEIYEPRFLDCSFGFRPGRSAHDVVYLELEILPTEVIEELFDLPNLVNYDRMERLFMKYKNYRKV